MLKDISTDIKNNFKTYILLFIVGTATRIPFLEKFQSHWDGPDWSIALVNYSFANKTPTEPGYPLYVFFGKLFSFILGDLHLSILAVSVFFSGLGAIAAYLIGRSIFGQTVGVVASVLFLTSPTFFYFGITANPYGLLFTTTSLVALTVYKIVIENKKLCLFLAALLSFAIGVRPQDTLFFIPLVLFGFFFLVNREKVKFILFFCIFTLAWFIPTAFAVGGVEKYLEYIIPFFQKGPGVNFSISRLVAIFPTFVKGFYLTFTISSLALIYYIKVLFRFFDNIKDNLKKQSKALHFFTLWIVPSFIFNLFVRSDHAAHQITYLSAFLYIIAYAISKIAIKKRDLVFVLVIVSIFNLITFFRIRDSQMIGPYVSQSYHYSELVKNTIRMSAIIDYVRKFQTQNTIIIVDSEIFRPLTYYLTEYKIYAFSALDSVVKSYPKYVHLGYQWQYKGKSVDTANFEIPKDVRTIVVIPNNREFLIVGADYETIKLEGNALVYKISIDTQSLIKISLRKLVIY